MVNSIRLYGRYIETSVKSQMQYRASYAMMTFGHLIQSGLEFIAILLLFDRFGNLEGWQLYEVAFLHGLVNISFAIADGATRGFDSFGNMVKSGDFDRLLTRPRSTALQIAGHELTLRRIVRLTQGVAILLWAALALDIAWTIPNLMLLLAAISGGAALFAGLVILQATLAFWTTETLEIMNTVTYGGLETTQYPMPIYRSWFRRFFTLVVPLACVSYFPAIAIMGIPDPLGSPLWFQYVSPIIGILFLIIALQIWKIGVRHYLSTGS